MRGSNNLVLHRINTMDGTIETVLLNDLIAVSQSVRQWAVSGDGTVYFWAAGMGNPSGLFRYRWEQGVEYLASEEELDGSYALLAVGNQLFGLSGERVFLYEDGIFVEFGILGLPENLNEIKYHLSERRPAQSWQHPDSNRLDISGLQPGLYCLQLRQDGRLHGRAAFVKR